MGDKKKDWHDYKPEDFVDKRSYEKFRKRVGIPKQPKVQNDGPKINRDHEAWRRWAKVNNETQ